jgi:aldose 1-epimerase
MVFAAQDGKFGGLETLRVSDADTGSTAVIARRGATLLSWLPGGFPDVIDGYRDEEEFRTQDGVRCGLMAPFSNRIRGARYTFDGQQHDLMPGVPESERLVYHGFLRLLDCDVVSVDAGDRAATVRLATTAIRPGAFPGYPFAVDLEIEYTLTARGLTVGLTGQNVGERPAPYGSGWHPYFRLGAGPVDRLELHVPARATIRADDALIPLDGDRAVADEVPFRTPRLLGDAVLDVAYTDLARDADGVARTVLRDPATGDALTVRQSDGLMHVFTGDTLARDRRTSIALEPVELMTDAFNRPDCADAVVLAPGAQREFRFGVEVTPGAR